jgi:hypothetical protein
MSTEVSNYALNIARQTLTLARDTDLFGSMKTDYAADKTLERIENTLSKYDEKIQESKSEHVVTEGQFFLHKDMRTGEHLWLNVRSGNIFAEEAGDKVPLNEHEVSSGETYEEAHGRPDSSDLRFVFVDKDAEETHQKNVDTLNRRRHEVEFHTVSEEVWIEDGQINYESLKQVDRQFPGNLSRLLRHTLVEGEQHKLEDIEIPVQIESDSSSEEE